MSPDPQAPVAATPSRPTTRRWFLRTVGAASAALPFAPLLPAAAQTSPPGTVTPPSAAPSSPAPPPPAPAPANAAASSEFAADARTLTELVERRFGARLGAADLEAVRADLQDGLESGRALRNLALTNSDEPDVVFQARALED